MWEPCYHIVLDLHGKKRVGRGDQITLVESELVVSIELLGCGSRLGSLSCYNSLSTVCSIATIELRPTFWLGSPHTSGFVEAITRRRLPRSTNTTGTCERTGVAHYALSPPSGRNQNHVQRGSPSAPGMIISLISFHPRLY